MGKWATLIPKASSDIKLILLPVLADGHRNRLVKKDKSKIIFFVKDTEFILNLS